MIRVGLVLWMLSLFTCAFGAKILYVSLLASPSHHIWNEALVEGLLQHGHNVTMIGHDKAKFVSDNYTVLHIDGMYDLMETKVDDFVQSNSIKSIYKLFQMCLMICEYDLKSESLNTLMNYPKDFFDMIIFDNSVGHCLYPLLEYFNYPSFVSVSPFGLPPYISEAIGNQIYSYIPYYTLAYDDRMTLLQRFQNVLIINLELIIKKYFYFPAAYKQAQTIFGNDIRKFEEVEKDFSLLLSSVDPILDFPQPLPPNIIPVGGLHVKPAKELLQDLRLIIDNAKHGAIYFSFGTNIKVQNIGDGNKRAFIEAFSKLPQIVLWKLDEEIQNLPENVIIRKWFPQNDVLGHENVKLFISHGGGLSTQEAKYHGVPIVGVPFMIDQYNNMGKIESRKLGKTLDLTSLTAENIYNTITEVMDNKIYFDNMKEISRKFRDQPQTPLERGVFWIEHVLRNRNTTHLEPASRHMTIYQPIDLDILVIIIASFTLLVFAIHTIWRLITTAIRKKPVKKQKTK